MKVILIFASALQLSVAVGVAGAGMLLQLTLVALGTPTNVGPSESLTVIICVA